MDFRFLFIISMLLLFLSGCLDTDFDDPNTEFVLFASLDENEDFFVVGDDQVRVLSVRFVVDNIELVATGDNEEFASEPMYLNLNNFSLQSEIFIGSGVIIGGSYTSVEMDLIHPPLNANINDDELIERNEAGDVIQRYSFVIQGIYNGQPFFFKSAETPRVSFSFDRNINMPETLGTLRVSLLAEWKEWFLTNERDALLDPNDPQNSEEIKQNFLNLFTPQVFTVGEL